MSGLPARVTGRPAGGESAGVPATPEVVVPAPEAEALELLAGALDDLGYRQLYAQGVGTGPFAPDRMAALVGLEDWPAAERHALRLLALGADADRAALPGELGPVVDALVRAGLARAEGPVVGTADWVLVPVLGGHLLTRLPPGYTAPGPDGGRAYLGPDSLRLAAALPSAVGRRVLDVGAGCGVQGLLAVQGAAEAVLVDVEPDSLWMAARNRVLNRVPWPVRVLGGDLYEPVAGEAFDLVVALPPSVPTAPGAAQTEVTAGGPDGLDFLRRLVGGAREHLRAGGELVALCQLLCRGDTPLLAGELATLAPGLEARLVVGEWHPLQPYLVDLATTLCAHQKGGDVRALVERYRVSLRSGGVSGVCTALVRLRRPAAAIPGEVRVVGGRPTRPDEVATRASGVELVVDGTVRVATVGGTAAAVLEGPTAALLAALDGRRTVAEAAVVAWGRLGGADPTDVTDQAVRRVDQLRHRGLVTAAPGGRD